VHNTTENPVIWTEELVYSNSSSGKLGVRIVYVDPEYTSQKCSRCVLIGNRNGKMLSAPTVATLTMLT